MNSSSLPVGLNRAHNQALGAKGEALASDYLVSRGFQVIARNWHCRYGELDLIMRDDDTIVAVEVKTRRGLGYGSPLEAITARKAARLWRLLLEWRRTNDLRGIKLRVDAVGIVLPSDGSAPDIQHLRAIS